MPWSDMGWCLEGLWAAPEPRWSCCNRVLSRKLWHLRLEAEAEIRTAPGWRSTLQRLNEAVMLSVITKTCQSKKTSGQCLEYLQWTCRSAEEVEFWFSSGIKETNSPSVLPHPSEWVPGLPDNSPLGIINHGSSLQPPTHRWNVMWWRGRKCQKRWRRFPLPL